jgi:polysaccharide pyruvyl transferase WcaK-like protein
MNESNEIKRINILGNFSGRNAGDAAILGGLLEDVAALFPGAVFTIPTINTAFVKREYSGFNVKPISLLPWNLSLKILGLPVITSCLKADLILVTDAILFDRKLYNPLFNYLWTLSYVLPMAKKRNIPIILYNCSLGPVKRKNGQNCLRRVIQNSDVVILRDKESKELLQSFKIDHPQIYQGADCALNAEPVADQRFEEIRRKEKLDFLDHSTIGFNVNSYIDAFVRESGEKYGRERLIDVFAQTVDKVIDDLDVNVVFVETQHMDMSIATQVVNKIRNQDRIRMISNIRYSYREICSLLKRLDLFVGMRTHSLILSSGMGVVPVGIVTYPKNRGYMRTLNLEKNLIEFKDLTVETFASKIIQIYGQRREIRQQMLPAVAGEKAKAKASAQYLNQFKII